MKKTTSFLLTVIMLVTMLTGINITATAATYSGSCGTNVKWKLDTVADTLSITGEGAMKNYSGGTFTPWYSYRSDVKKITIGSGVTTIGNSAFAYCDKLNSITLPNIMSSIGTEAFLGCTSLTNVTIPNSVVKIGTHAFSGCSSLKNIVIPNSVKIMDGYAIYACNNLKSIIIPKSVTSIGHGTFLNCKNLTIYGYAGSYIEKFVKGYRDLTFKSLSVTATLSVTIYIYDGKVKTPSVTVKDNSGRTLKKDTDYTVSFPNGRKNADVYTVTVKLKGIYSGTLKETFIICPKVTSISSVTAKSKGFNVKWNKQTTQTTGYQLQYSTSSNFSNPQTVNIFGNNATSKDITKLTGNKKYYVRIRTYKSISLGKIYSSWSSAKSVTTKK